MKKAISMILAGTMLAAMLAGCASSAPAAAPAASAPAETSAEAPAGDFVGSSLTKVQEIKEVTTLSSTDPAVQRMIEANDRIREATNGMIDIQMYADGQMLVGAEGVEAMKAGSAVFVWNDPLTLSNYVPIYETICAPYLYSSSADIEKFAESEEWAAYMKEGDELGFHLIASTANFGARSVIADGVEVRSVEDCKGLNIRVPNESLYINSFEAFGASYGAMGWGDGITAIQTGQLNGAESTAQRVVTSGVYELLKKPVFSEIKWLVAPSALQVGYDFWKTLPEDVQQLITEEYEKCCHEMNVYSMEAEEDYIQQLIDAGVTVIRADEIDMAGFEAAAAKACANMDRYEEVKAAVDKALGK